ncbi:hypothetical protein [Legionella cincinnatiensis]|uniref:Uncharacterized protein n=1 Tax=Legionella cincinnatiensis TaxID=28085 RepID=A0A378IJC5_9GAMM|nr:hypothetical protein [Legionella cincinnatiensis]KTC93259.1 hypothetical protein Lcin_0297 [Legionella cincinnatiensis]STX35040.1 Uncharacterised protein [Legionella cincinnatiensis]
MKREHIIELLVNQFAENIKNLPDETLQGIQSGKLVISLTPTVDKEAGGRAIVSRGNKQRLVR